MLSNCFRMLDKVNLYCFAVNRADFFDCTEILIQQVNIFLIEFTSRIHEIGQMRIKKRDAIESAAKIKDLAGASGYCKKVVIHLRVEMQTFLR